MYSLTDMGVGFSSTIPTIEFLPSQVHQVPNIVGDGALEDSALNDSRLDWSGVFHPSKPREMNDVSVWACSFCGKFLYSIRDAR